MEWFIFRDGKQEECFNIQQLRSLIEKGELLNTDIVWTQGMEDWAMIKNVPEFSSPPPIPKNIEGQAQANNTSPPLPSIPSNQDTEIIYAGFWKRMAALFLDGIVLAVFSIPIYLLAGLMSIAGNKELATLTNFLLAVILSATYFTSMESSEKSATYGKRWMGLKALDTEGRRLSTWNAFARWALHILSYVTLYAGFLIQPFTARKQALHDIIANTIVVERIENKPSPSFVKWMIAVSAFFVALIFIGVIAAVAIPAYQSYQSHAKELTKAEMLNSNANNGKSPDKNITDPFDNTSTLPKLSDKFLNAVDVYDKGDFVQASKLFQSLAEQGDMFAQFNLGVMYTKGQGLAQDYNQAVDWFRKAAEQGLAGAQFRLGSAYDNGRGVAQDYKQAFDWYIKAAEQGNAGAQNNLGSMYDKGLGVVQDYKQAVVWYRKAADQGLASAQFNLGSAYAEGRGLVQDYKQAVDWYRKAAEQGNAGAQNNLGVLYNDGQGIMQNYILAHMWFNLASSNGISDAIENRDNVAKEMTKGQIAEAQKLAKECEQRNYKNCDYAN
jgi:TPR repeat protein/uncharacterized RDD family membrane protein YckC